LPDILQVVHEGDEKFLASSFDILFLDGRLVTWKEQGEFLDPVSGRVYGAVKPPPVERIAIDAVGLFLSKMQMVENLRKSKELSDASARNPGEAGTTGKDQGGSTGPQVVRDHVARYPPGQIRSRDPGVDPGNDSDGGP
jgi:hypothetical protein